VKHKAILIDVHDFSVTEIEVDQDNLQDIYDALGCDLFDCVTLPNGDAIYIDDEGLLKNPDRFFALIGYTSILAGNGLIMGVDDEGASIAPKLDITSDAFMPAFFVRGAEGWVHRVSAAPIKAPSAGMTITGLN